MSIVMMTPVEARGCSGPIRKRWRNYKEEAIVKADPAMGLPMYGIRTTMSTNIRINTAKKSPVADRMRKAGKRL